MNAFCYIAHCLVCLQRRCDVIAPGSSVAVEIALIVGSAGDGAARAPEAGLAHTVRHDVGHTLAVLTRRAQLAARRVVRTCSRTHSSEEQQ